MELCRQPGARFVKHAGQARSKTKGKTNEIKDEKGLWLPKYQSHNC